MLLIFMSNNPHKLTEIQPLLADTSLTVIPYGAVTTDHIDPDETGATFEENAAIKVNALSNTNHWILAEDSGIVVDGLDGRPGIHSARYAGPNATRHSMCTKLLTELGNSSNRTARFVAVMALKSPDGTCHTFRGEIEGTIAHAMDGHDGFGYDPIFIPEGYHATMAALGNDIKKQLSHRARALAKVVTYLHQEVSLK